MFVFFFYVYRAMFAIWAFTTFFCFLTGKDSTVAVSWTALCLSMSLYMKELMNDEFNRTL